MYCIVKNVYGLNYWWNTYYKRWEGLKCNATFFDTEHEANSCIWCNRFKNTEVSL